MNTHNITADDLNPRKPIPIRNKISDFRAKIAPQIKLMPIKGESRTNNEANKAEPAMKIIESENQFYENIKHKILSSRNSSRKSKIVSQPLEATRVISAKSSKTARINR